MISVFFGDVPKRFLDTGYRGVSVGVNERRVKGARVVAKRNRYGVLSGGRRARRAGRRR
jgi:hypothetical protein